jgi:hypothetical protein
MSRHVDLVVLSRTAAPLGAAVARAVAAQRGVNVRVHRVVGAPRGDDPNRMATIAGARNAGKRLGSAPWVMFLDDDVELGPDTIARLVDGLSHRPAYAALGADYGQECGACGIGPRGHVSMGATLFRRAALAGVRFRWEPGRCECQCCCDDLRRNGLGIAYLPGAHARHRASRPAAELETAEPKPEPEPPPTPAAGRILVAFDRRHYDAFRRRFLRSLRASGNAAWVTAVGYGLYPSERRVLERLGRVEVVPLPVDGVMPPVRRLRDFQPVVARWPDDTPVAYWDAGDIHFQGKLDGLWSLVAAHPDRLLAVREPLAHPRNTAVARWTKSITDPAARRFAHDLLTRRPFLNSGFAAGTARALLAYLRAADFLLHSPALRGTSDWGDQTVLNLYCHTDPSRWHEIAATWNYCLLDRRDGEVHFLPDGRIVATDGLPIRALHGHARSLRHHAISRAFP